METKRSKFKEILEKVSTPETMLQEERKALLSPLIEYVNIPYLQLIISQYFISNKSGIWSLPLIVHSKG